ncbi:conserved protein of unknown function [Vibrio variabilis]|uniref:ORC1/DEAH AAA+ ATPase domain-containing protein n=1 Tax=Vibrio variabilis TaxID=990271 RepID=A0ABQ0JLR4_9VIBR|nr:conserved protein of unknown function [Vibrio variabilis]
MTIHAIENTWPSHYSEADIKTCLFILGWLKQYDQAQSWLAKRARLSASLANQVLKGNYGNERGSSPSAHIAKMHQAIVNLEQTEEQMPTIETTVFEAARRCCNTVRADRTIGAFTGIVGTGKTFGLKHYASHNANTYYLRGRQSMNTPTLINRLVKLTGTHANTRAPLDDKINAVVEALIDTDSLLIIDEAENISDTALKSVRDIFDEAEVGVVLAGTERLLDKVMPTHSVFHQIGSRITYSPVTITGITKRDTEQMIIAAFPNADIDDALVNAIFSYTDGSVRRLARAIIPHLKRFTSGVKTLPLTTELVHQVAKQVLNITPVQGPKRSIQEGQ